MSPARGVVDWSLAERTASAIAGDGNNGHGAQLAVREACSEAIGPAAAYSRLPVPAAPPRAELVDRREWSRAALRTLVDASAPLEMRLAEDLSLPGPLGPVARLAVGAGAGIEIGAAVGYAARRVLGQYDVAVFGDERPRRLLFVGHNIESASAELGADRGLFVRWIALHEITHVLQLDGVPWLVPHLRSLAGELLEDAAGGVDAGAVKALLGRAARNPREVFSELMRGHLFELLTGSGRRATLDRLQAAMSVIEGHAEHVMDACGTELDPRLGELRARLDARRERRRGLADVVARLLGLELKLRQYREGKRFFDTVVDTVGPDGAAAVWSSPEALPDLDEIARPRAWLARVGLVAAST
jgi:coenzyme F420 biosynthesis associated uncharacterized protein